MVGRMQEHVLPTPSPDWAVFLDVDGTLVEIAARPELAQPTPRVRRLMSRLASTVGGAVALVSGRSIAGLDELFAPLVLPAAGLHGLERRDANGCVHFASRTEGRLHGVKTELMAFAENHGGLLIEDKGMTLALHYRGAPHLERAAQEKIGELAATLGDEFQIQRGKMVLELRPSGHNKGTAISEFMQESPFAGRTPVFVGDDVTDEAGFDVVNRLGGHSVRVGVDASSTARWRAGDVEEVLTWLENTGARDAEGG